MKKVVCIEIGELFLKACEVDIEENGTMTVGQDFCCDVPLQCCKNGYPTMLEYLIYVIEQELGEVLGQVDDICFAVSSDRIKRVCIERTVTANTQHDIESMFDLIFPDLPNGQYICKSLVQGTYNQDGQEIVKLDVFALPFNMVEQYYRLAYELGKNCLGVVDTRYAIAHLYKKYITNTRSVLITLSDHAVHIDLYNDTTLVDSVAYNDSSFLEMIMHVHDSELAINSLTTVDTLLVMKDNVILGKTGRYADTQNCESIDEIFHQFCLNLEKRIETLCQNNNFTFSNCYVAGCGIDVAHFQVELQKQLNIPVSAFYFQSSNLKENELAALPAMNLLCACAAIQDVNLLENGGVMQTPILNKACNLTDFFKKK